MEFDESHCIVGGFCPRIYILEKTVLGMTIVQMNNAFIVL